jgi:DNA-binding response OmpR family regulator
VDQAKPVILIVEDDLDIADMLNAYFRVQGYEVLTVNWGEDGVRAAHSNEPNLIILDIRLPDIDGFEVAARLRASRKTKAIPIIFLTEKRARTDRLKGLEMQADDYITKPFDIQELRLRVRNALQRAGQNSLTNAVTNLAEGNLVDEALTASLARGNESALVVSLRNLDQFREVYGFVAADDLMRAVAIMLRDAVRDTGNPQDFTGHLSATDFVILTSANGAPALKVRIRRRLEQSFEYFYSDQHREAGTFAGHALGVQVGEIRLATAGLPDLAALKAELESFCH